MSTLTKEWLQLRIAELEEERDATPGVVNEDAVMALAAMKLALASLEANGTLANEGTITATQFKPVADLYEVTVPSGRSTTFTKDAAEASDCRVMGWSVQEYVKLERYQAAMLQGTEPVTTPYKLPFKQWLSQQTGTIDVECGCVMTEVFFHWLRVAYEAGNSPQCRKISNSSTKNFRENAETSTKCWCHTCRPVTFNDSRLVVCPECGNKRCPHANDHRNACTGSNEPGQEGSAYPAAPQQEVTAKPKK